MVNLQSKELGLLYSCLMMKKGSVKAKLFPAAKNCLVLYNFIIKQCCCILRNSSEDYVMFTVCLHNQLIQQESRVPKAVTLSHASQGKDFLKKVIRKCDKEMRLYTASMDCFTNARPNLGNYYYVGHILTLDYATSII